MGNWLKYYVKRGEIGLIINWQGENNIWTIPGLMHKTCARANDKPQLTSLYPADEVCENIFMPSAINGCICSSWGPFTTQ